MFNNKIKAINPVEYAKGIVANEKIRFDDFNGEKKYFSKYLPVDGDIQVGDSILDPNNNVYKCTRIDNIYLNCSGYNGLVRISRCKKVKLFLCSRDIQVGDTNLQHYDPLTNTKCADEPRSINNEEELLYLKDYIEKVERYDCFKVLGEISPEATWVKEGDTFNNDEIKQHIVPVKAGFEKYYDTEHQEEMERDVYEAVVGYYKIKGSCGNFH